MDYCSCSPQNTSFYIGKTWKKNFQKIRNTQRCDMLTSFLHLNDVTNRRADSVRSATVRVFYLFHGLVRVCEINRIHHWCPVGKEIPQPEDQPFQRVNGALVKCGTWLYRFLIFAPLLTLPLLHLATIWYGTVKHIY